MINFIHLYQITVLIFLAHAVSMEECVLKGNGFKYKEEVIPVTGVILDNPIKFAIDYTSNILYFNNYNAINDTNEPFRVNLSTGECSFIEELSPYCSFTVDQERSSVYAGCSDGLYHYDSNIQKFVLIHSKRNINTVYYYNDSLYYKIRNFKKIFKFSYVNVSEVLEFSYYIYQFVIDKDNEIISYDDSVLVSQQLGSENIIYYSYTIDVKALAVDSSGKTFACEFSEDEISLVDKDSSRLRKFSDANWCHAIAFDKEDNVLYADWEKDTIVRLEKC